MTALEKDISDWSEIGRSIFAQKERLDDKANDIQYSKDFETVYYAVSKSYIDANAVQVSMQRLKKRMTSLSSSDPLKRTLREFVAISMRLYDRNNSLEFKRFLISNGRMPVDPVEEMRKAKELEEKRRKEAEEKERVLRERQRREREERERREREEKERKAKELEEKQRKEAEEKERVLRERQRREMERQRREEEKRKCIAYENRIRLEHIVKIVVSVLIFVMIILIIVLTSIKSSKNKEYYRLLADADRYVTEMLYDDALASIDEARKVKTDKNTLSILYQKELDIRSEKIKKTENLKKEIQTALNVFRNISFKYGRPESDIKTVQEKINTLKKIAPNDADTYQKELDKLKKRIY